MKASKLASSPCNFSHLYIILSNSTFPISYFLMDSGLGGTDRITRSTDKTTWEKHFIKTSHHYTLKLEGCCWIWIPPTDICSTTRFPWWCLTAPDARHHIWSQSFLTLSVDLTSWRASGGYAFAACLQSVYSVCGSGTFSFKIHFWNSSHYAWLQFLWEEASKLWRRKLLREASACVWWAFCISAASTHSSKLHIWHFSWWCVPGKSICITSPCPRPSTHYTVKLLLPVLFDLNSLRASMSSTVSCLVLFVH